LPKTKHEIFNDKVRLIYEYNKRSPLFLRMANTEIENNNLDNALLILQSGIKIYPQYAAAYFLIGKAYTLLGDYGLALKNYKLGSDLINSKKSYDYYLNELENIKRQRSLFDNNVKNIFLFDEEESGSKSSSGEKTAAYPKKEIEKTNPIEENLNELANKISNAKIPEVSEEIFENEDSFLDNSTGANLIVSETLAKIYTTQGEYLEAIKVYKKLMNKFPNKIKLYSDKINQLQSKIDS